MLGILTLITLPGVLWQAMQPSKRYGTLRTFTASIFLMMAIGLVGISGSRGSAISIIVTLVAFWFWKPTRRWGKLGLLVLVLGVIVAPFIFTTTFERFAVTEGDTLLGRREVLWQGAWQLIAKYPMLGVGIGNAPFELMRLINVKGPPEVGISIHNPILTVWCETGLLGTILYIGVLVSAGWSFVKNYQWYRNLGEEWPMSYFALVVSTFLGYMVSWIKGGGMQSSFTYFLLLSFLLIPSSLDSNKLESSKGIEVQETGRGKARIEAPER
jgi:O-antigen ligase